MRDWRRSGRVDGLAWRLALTIAILVPSRPARALDPRLFLSQYVHTSWVQSDGVMIPSISGLAQTNDGYLWLATWQGLWRFDGMRFRRWNPPTGEKLDNTVRAVAASRNGGLWVGTKFRLLSLERGHLTDYSGRFGVTEGVMVALREDAGGKLWMAAAQHGVPGITVLNGKAETISQNTLITSFSTDSKGTLWGIGAKDFYVCTPEGCRPQSLDFLRQVPQRRERPVRCMLQDRDGNVWLGTEGDGLFLVRHGRVEQFTRRDGLSADYVEALLEDREGNIWVGTSSGVDRFREPKVVRWTDAQGLVGDAVGGVYATRGGDILAAPLVS